VAITGVEVRLLRLDQVEPFDSAGGIVIGQRPLTIVRLVGDEGFGWGECEALPQAGYTPEWAAGAFTRIRDDLAPGLLGTPLSSRAVRAVVRDHLPIAPMAVAAVEQAALDGELRASGRSLAQWLGVPGSGPPGGEVVISEASGGRSGHAEVDARSGTGRAPSVPAGAVVGLAPDLDTLVERVAILVAAGYVRVKVKVRPGWDVEPLGVLRRTFATLELQADGNGSYTEDDAIALAPLADLGLTCLEQPLPADDLAGAARLRRRLGVPLAADESASTPSGVEATLRAGAADVVVVKPARLGGLQAALAVHGRCAAGGVGLMAGGLLEAGLGRRALVAVAALPGFTVTGDCSPSSRWLAGDPWPEMDLVDGRVPVHLGPGVAPEPVLERLDRATIDRVVLGDV
jgi:O-succinylbenzoate synthase